MPQPRLIIDGYNLLHAAGLARRSYGVGGLERARTRLLNLVAGLLTDEERIRTVVVFDARGGDSTLRSTQHFEGMQVEFPSRLREADDRIEDWIADHSAPKGLCIVSGDRRLHAAIKRRRGTFETGPQFLARLHRRSDEISGEAEKPTPGMPSPQEVEWWQRRLREP